MVPTFPIVQPGVPTVAVAGSDAKSAIRESSPFTPNILNVYVFGSSLSMYHVYVPDAVLIASAFLVVTCSERLSALTP